MTISIPNKKYYAIDTETTGLDRDAQLVGVSIAWGDKEEESIYLPCGHKKDLFEEYSNLELDEIKTILRPILENSNCIKIFHHFQFDYIQLRKIGLDVFNYEDTKLMAYLLNPEERTSLKDLGRKYSCSNIKGNLKELTKSGSKRLSPDEVSIPILGNYCRIDSQLTYELYFKLLSELKEDKELLTWYYKIELPLAKVLGDMYLTGILLDVSRLDALKLPSATQIKELKKEIVSLAGKDFNPNSPQQLKEVLYKDLKLPIAEKTDEQALQDILGTHPIVEKLLEYRKLTKLMSTYIIPLKEHISKNTGRVHTFLHQTSTATGRLSSESPNLQNIPKRNKLGRQIRQAFISKPGHSFLIADYNQIELKIASFLAGEDKLFQMFERGEDIHEKVAKQLFPDQFRKDKISARIKAKAINFGILYGLSPHGLAKMIKSDEKRAKYILDNYFRQYPKLKEYANNMIRQAKIHGFVKTLGGRKRYINYNLAEMYYIGSALNRMAINTPVQGSAADLIKITMVQLDKALKRAKINGKIILQIHDELIIEVKNEDISKAKEIILKEMTTFYEFPIPEKLQKIITINLKVAKSWE